MRAVVVVVSDVLDKHLFETVAPEDQEAGGARSADSANEPLGESVRSRRSNGTVDDSDALGAEHLVEALRELGVPRG
jgi:hypothetical protein